MCEGINFPDVPDLKPWFLTLDDLGPPPLDLAAFWGNAAPVELEIGSGRGLFLWNSGQRAPDRNFLGIEYDFKEGRRGAARLKKKGLHNARILGADARIVLDRYLPARSMAAVHVYFPDPWWKRRHRKRRIFSHAFLIHAARLLEDGGDLHAWTDVAEYFGVMVDLVARFAEFVPQPTPVERIPEHDMDYHTSFERKMRKAGCPIYRAHWKRAPRGTTAETLPEPEEEL